ncbi:putative disease resistance protein RGA3 isoform X1 [Cucumis melo var. makuwa]|uniref:Disease resistance protein RGA3 isoform X1 n=3 Tax=Cucumis melo TaxID=3656 RepID=A0A5D3D021_CUCMM|nr:putative disease resistance protein RGA3 isoform X1 [Cucumis melo var. makuwa]TYK16970.1 putative disease resistance protein RGA3 isoform X1 [Cucumis melo var. makuwa]
MAEFLWTFAVQEVLKKVLTLAADKIGLAWGLEKELSELSQWLLKSEAILGDINRKKLHPSSVRLWVADLQLVVHEADDLLDELVYEHLRTKVEKGLINKVCYSVSSGSNIFIIFRFKMVKKVRIIIEKLRKCYFEAAPLGLVGEEFIETENDLGQIRETISKLDDFEVVGREFEVSSIVKQMVDASDRYVTTILPIVGMGGIGKTTLAKTIFHHEEIRGHFDETIWICVSEPFLINKILGAILQMIKGVSSGLDNKEALLRELQKVMRGKRYFLVLDDVWNENLALWTELKNCLLSFTEKSENGIIVTTRSVEVGKIMECTLSSHHLGKLSDEQCWSLFKKSANANELPMNLELKDIQEELVKRFGGVPLVARVLGGALKFEGVYEKWVMSLRTTTSIPLQDEDLVLSTLKLSVDRLPSFSLKRCFAYCSNFSKGFKFRKEELIQMWMAQGFIQLHEGINNITMEENGEKYFNILLSRSLFQDIIKDDRGRITHCKMHDLIYEIACIISNSQKLQQEQIDLLDKGSRTNHRINNAQNLRTLICNRQMLHKTIYGKIANCTRLRVLVVDSSITKLPESIGKMKHLRYLDISNSKIEELPNSISLLHNLQTLKFGSSMKHLPQNLSKLANLRHLKFSIPQTPPHLSRLTQLQTLSGFAVGFEKGCKIGELGFLKDLKGRLELSNLDRIENKEEAMSSKLVEKNLCELLLEWDLHILRECSSYNDLEVLEGLQPHKNLQFLSIINFAGQLLPAAIFVENLAVIHLRHCVRCEALPMLGQLPNLEELNISNLLCLRSIGNEFYGNYDHPNNNHKVLFPKLKKFVLSHMHNLEQWEGLVFTSKKDAIFPLLEDLNIRHCPILTSIPNIFRCPLKKLHIYGCDEVTRLPKDLQLCTSIEDLKIVGCLKLILNVQNMHGLSRFSINGLQKFPQGLANLKNLKEMTIIECSQDCDFSPLMQLSSLVKLHLVIFPGRATEQLPQQLEHLIALRSLYINDFDGIEVLPEWLGNFTSLEALGLCNCRNLEQFPSKKAMQCLTQLVRVDVLGCPQLSEFADFVP